MTRIDHTLSFIEAVEQAQLWSWIKPSAEEPILYKAASFDEVLGIYTVSDIEQVDARLVPVCACFNESAFGNATSLQTAFAFLHRPFFDIPLDAYVKARTTEIVRVAAFSHLYPSKRPHYVEVEVLRYYRKNIGDVIPTIMGSDMVTLRPEWLDQTFPGWRARQLVAATMDLNNEAAAAFILADIQSAAIPMPPPVTLPADLEDAPSFDVK